jgi:hypothetical protein
MTFVIDNLDYMFAQYINVIFFVGRPGIRGYELLAE